MTHIVSFAWFLRNASRIVHRLVCNIVSSLLDYMFIDNSFSNFEQMVRTMCGTMYSLYCLRLSIVVSFRGVNWLEKKQKSYILISQIWKSYCLHIVCLIYFKENGRKSLLYWICFFLFLSHLLSIMEYIFWLYYFFSQTT